jgi:hypothetical protein
MPYIEKFNMHVTDFSRGKGEFVHYSIDRVKNEDLPHVLYEGEIWADKGPSAGVKVPLKIIVESNGLKATIIASSSDGEHKATRIYAEKFKPDSTQSVLSLIIARMERKIPEIEAAYEFFGVERISANAGLRSCSIMATNEGVGCHMDFESDAADLDELIRDGMEQVNACFDRYDNDLEFEYIDYDGDL